MGVAIRPPLVLALLVLLTSCQSFRDCGDVDVTAAAALPEMLSETGLYREMASRTVAESAIEFEPRFPLWTDGTDKRRWLLLPEGGQVDTSDTVDWRFPVGTRLFKEFARDGQRLETRLIHKNPEGWAAVSYVWAGDDAARQLEPLPDVAGTTHDIPGAAQCLACHGGRPTFSLGFTATQLDPATREALFDAGHLTEPVQTELDVPPTELAGLGVLHGNCSHCHNADQQATATDCYVPPESFDFSLPPDLQAVADAPAVLTARYLLGGPNGSDVLHRMANRNESERKPSMPPLGTELVDDAGLAAVEAFIAALPADDR
ncbi:MAG: hypothetical protein KC912_22875 [Proteobacteria bacterium]|nr:hypothetical protein [Pseudomonadota bacterium]